MTLPIKTAHLFLAVCLCPVLAISMLVRSQELPPGTTPSTSSPEQQNQNGPLPSQTPGWAPVPIKEDWVGQVGQYRKLMQDLVSEESLFQAEIANGNDPHRTNYRAWLQIREDDEQIMRTILLDAYHNQQKLLSDFYAAYGGKNAYFKMGRPLPPDKPTRMDVAHQQDAVLQEAIAKLKRELREEDFKKLDEHLYRQFLVDKSRPIRVVVVPTPGTPATPNQVGEKY